MRVVADLHIHSRFARGCSRDLTVENLALWAEKKGVQILATGDFTHPGWFAELGEELVEEKPGLYRHRSGKYKTLFLYGTEIASIYKQGEKVRRIHNLVFAPSRETAGKIILALENLGCNLKSDGRPIVGVKCPDLVALIKEVNELCELIPAHVWTPHFGVFGSLSGFDTLKEAFGDQAKFVRAVETGLSSNPAMNWRISALDKITLVSNSDCHGLPRLGREANILEIDPENMSYAEIFDIINSANPKKFVSTIEFFPEEGKYHLDGHRDCKFSCEPEKTRVLGGKCPICRKALLLGVLNRVEALADRPEGFKKTNAPLFLSTIGLEGVISSVLGVGKASKKVQAVYTNMVERFSELEILLQLPYSVIVGISNPEITSGIKAVREGKVNAVAGFDGLYGKIDIKKDFLSNKAKLF